MQTAADTLVIELERTDPTFPYLLTGGSGTAVPREEVERLGPAFSVRPVGDGPYVVQKWVRGARLQLARNPYYQGPEPPHLDGVDVLTCATPRGYFSVTGISWSCASPGSRGRSSNRSGCSATTGCGLKNR